MSVATFIATQRVEFQVPHATSCRALGVSQAWFYKWRMVTRRAGMPAGSSWRIEDRSAVRRPQGPVRLAAGSLRICVRRAGW